MAPRKLERRPSLESLVERVDQQRPGDVPGDTVPTGFPSIDRMLGGGLRRRDLVVLGGDVGSGKSALALGLALRTAQGTGVALFSGEMDEERLMERALAIEGRATVDELRSARLNDQTRAGIGGAAVRLRDLPLTALPLAARDFETAAERLDPLRQLGLVVIDYLQLVPSPRGVVRSTQDEDLALVLQRLKALALERQVVLSSCRSCRSSTPSGPTLGPHSTTSDTWGRSSSTPTWCSGSTGRRCTTRDMGWTGRPS